MNSSDTDALEKFSAEASRIEEDATFNFVGHYEAANFWKTVSHTLNFPIVIFSAIAAFFSFTEPFISLFSSIIVTVLGSVNLYFRPAETAALHYRSGGKFKSLRDKARLYREVRLRFSKDSANKLLERLNELYEEKRVISEMGVPIPNFAYRRAKRKIDDGHTSYAVDEASQTPIAQLDAKNV